MSLAPMSPHSRWAQDLRGEGRAVRVSAHAKAGFLIVSTWKADGCVGTVRLLPGEASQLVAGIVEGVAHLAAVPTAPTSPATQLPAWPATTPGRRLTLTTSCGCLKVGWPPSQVRRGSRPGAG